MKLTLALCLIAGFAFPAAAEDVFQRPESCVLVATAQYDTCEVDNFFKCSVTGKQAGWIEHFEETGLVSITTRDQNHVETELIDLSGGGVQMTVIEGVHPKAVLDEGSGKISWSGTISMFGMTRPFSGKARLMAENKTTVLSGHDLQVIKGVIDLALPPPMRPMSLTTIVGYALANDLLVELEVEVIAGEVKKAVSLSLPGEPGFGEKTPAFGCKTLSEVETLLQEIPA